MAQISNRRGRTSSFDAANQQPPYVEYGPLVTEPPPALVQGAVLYGFFVRGSDTGISNLCQRVFEDPSQGAVRCTPLWDSHMLLTFGSAASLRSNSSPPIVLPEKQVILQVPVGIQYDSSPLRAVRPSLAWFAPFIWVDSAITMADGREVYGYPKGFGTVDLEPNNWKFALETLGGDTNQTWQPHVLIKVERHSTSLRRHSGDVEDTITRDMPDDMKKLFLASISSQWTQVFLKQFRAIEDGSLACLQQITTATYDVIRTGLSLLIGDDYYLSLMALLSDKIGSEVGLSSQRVATPFKLDLNMTMNAGQVLWPLPN